MNKSNQSGTTMVAIPVIAALIACGAITGCSGTNPDTPAAGAAATGAGSAAPVTIAKTAPVISMQASKPLPDGYPADIAPIYEPSTVTHAMKMGSGVALQYLVTAQTTDSVDVVAKSLAENYKAQNVRVNQTPLNDKGVGQIVVSKDGYGIAITYSAGDKPDTTSLTYNVNPQRGRH